MMLNPLTQKQITPNKFILSDQFFCQGRLVKVELYENCLSIISFNFSTTIKIDSEFQFQLIQEEDSFIGFKIYTKIPVQLNSEKETENPEDQNIELFFYNYQWNQAQSWNQHLSCRMKKKGFYKYFQIQKKIGEGNFSQVYLAKQIRTEKIFAVKKIIKNRNENQKDKIALQNQIKIMRSLNHQNIGKLFAVHEQGKVIYLVMENIDGISLETYLQKKHGGEVGGISKAERINFSRQILKAIRHMTNRGVLHRDLKPQNILLTKGDKQIKIIDFNLATFVNQKKYLFVRCGTAGYVAPEIIRIPNQKFDTVRLHTIGDMFSVGCIFYKMIFGDNLFKGTTQQIVKLNYKCNLSFNDSLKKSINAMEFQLLARMLQTNPDFRINASQALNHQYFLQVKQYVPSVSDEKQNKHSENRPRKRSFGDMVSQFGKAFVNKIIN